MIHEQASSLRLSIPEFICDNKLGSIPQPLPNQSFYMCFVGPPRSGKTSTAVSLISQKTNKKKKIKSIYRGVFDNIVVIAPHNSLKSLKNNVFEDLDEEKVFNDMTSDNLERIEQKIEEYRDEGEQTLLYVDDMASSLKDKAVLKLFNRLICNRRHLKLSVMMITQFLNSIPLSNRKLISHLFLWKSNNKKEYQSIYEEMVPLSKEEFYEITRYVYKSPHDFIYIDVDNSLFHNKFNKLTLSG